MTTLAKARDTYTITRTAQGWLVLKTEDGAAWLGSPIRIATYKSRKAAVTAASLLAGWRGRVVEVRP